MNILEILKGAGSKSGLVASTAGILLLGMVAPTLCAQIIPTERRIDWSRAGVEGGIPTVTTVFTNFSPGVTVSQLNSALQRCPSNQVVKLAAGSYVFSEPVQFGQGTGRVLRGSGSKSTTLTFNAHAGGYNIMIGGQTIDRTVPPSSQVRNWISGYAQGATTITLDNASGVPPVGHLLVLDQLNNNTWIDDDVQEGCSYCGRDSGERSQAQYVRITSKSGNNIGISPGLYMPNWAAQYNPQVFYWTQPDTEMCGIEDLSIVNEPNSGTYSIFISQAQNCWVRDVTIYKSPQAAVATSQCKNIEVRRISMLSNQGSGNLSYGVVPYMVSDFLMIDCIADSITAAVVLGPQAEGCVVAYNYFTNAVYSPTGWDIASMSVHDTQVSMNLFEGNWANKTYVDSIHGSNSHNTWLRNFFHGKQVGRTANTMAFAAQQYCLSNNIIGNILGTAGFHKTYIVSGASGGSTDEAIFVLGNFHGGPSPSWDSRVLPSTLIHGNYDTVNAKQMWSAAISDRAIPLSYFTSSKPAFFGNLPWPPYDPANPFLTSPTNLPAGYRHIFGSDPASGPVNQPPIVSATATPRSGAAPLSVNFSSTGSSDPEGNVLTYNWQFGDGGTSSAVNPSHTYSSDGAYTARLAVSDGVNTSTSANIVITVGNQAPTVRVTATPVSGPPPLSVAFSSSGSADPEGATLSYTWSFGDGTISTTPNPTHVYQTEGTYIAGLTISDGVKSASTNTTIVVTFGLVAAYSFDAGSGASLTDLSGNGNTGTINGATWTTSGRFGGGLSFNGAGAHVAIPGSSSLDLTSAMTLEAWVFPTSIGGWRDIIYRANDGYYLEASSPQTSGPVTGGTFAGSPLAGPTALALNSWSHVASTYDGTTIRLYVNGVQVASRAQSGSIQTSAAETLTLGGDPVSGTFFAGVLDEIRIYSRALSAGEIQTDMNSTSGPQPPSPPTGLRVLP